jgi:hypothetical protein
MINRSRDAVESAHFVTTIVSWNLVNSFPCHRSNIKIHFPPKPCTDEWHFGGFIRHTYHTIIDIADDVEIRMLHNIGTGAAENPPS